MEKVSSRPNFSPGWKDEKPHFSTGSNVSLDRRSDGIFNVTKWQQWKTQVVLKPGLKVAM